MEQDELEDELFARHVWPQLDWPLRRILGQMKSWHSKWTPSLLGPYYTPQTLLAVGLSVFVVLATWLVQTRRLQRWVLASSAGMASADEWEERPFDDVAVCAVRGPRASMEDRFVAAEVEVVDAGAGKSVRISAVLDGHGGEYAADYVKRHLTHNLQTKIRLLKLLSRQSRLTKRQRVAAYERLQPAGGPTASQAVLDYVGLSMDEYRDLNPAAAATAAAKAVPNPPANGGVGCDGSKPKRPNQRPSSSSSCVVLSSRVKCIEEVPAFPSGPAAQKGEDDEDDEPEDTGKRASIESVTSLDIASTKAPAASSSAANNKVKKRKKKGSSSSTKSPSSGGGRGGRREPEIVEYLSSAGDILYAKLLRDEIALVDANLVRDSRKAGQIGGTTLLLTVLDDGILWVANVGDSRGILACGKRDVTPMSYDHKPSQLKEKRRIEEAGGFVCMNGVWRVQGILATSRALGDFPLKEKNLITCEPDVLSFRLAPASPGAKMAPAATMASMTFGAKMSSMAPAVTAPDFALLATDGLWDTHTNEEAAAHVRKCVARGGDLITAAKSLVRAALRKDSLDNVTVLLMDLKRFRQT